EDGIRDFHVTGVQTCALPICAIASARLFASVPKIPRTAEVTVVAPGFWMPRIVMHMCSQESTTITPRGCSRSINRSATCEVSRRSEERRGGKECGAGGWAEHE